MLASYDMILSFYTFLTDESVAAFLCGELAISFSASSMSGVIASPKTLTSTCSIKLTDLPSNAENAGSLIKFTTESTSPIDDLNQLVKVTNIYGDSIPVERHSDVFGDGFQLIYFDEKLVIKYEGTQESSFIILYSGNKVILR